MALKYWLLGVKNYVFDFPIINYDNQNIVNSLDNFWLKGAEIKLNELKNNYISHSHKYKYLLWIIEAIKANKEIIP